LTRFINEGPTFIIALDRPICAMRIGDAVTTVKYNGVAQRSLLSLLMVRERGLK
jgi:hypothetical protein